MQIAIKKRKIDFKKWKVMWKEECEVPEMGLSRQWKGAVSHEEFCFCFVLFFKRSWGKR